MSLMTVMSQLISAQRFVFASHLQLLKNLLKPRYLAYLTLVFIKMFMSLKQFFVSHLSRRIVRMENVEKGAAIQRKTSRDWLEKDQ